MAGKTDSHKRNGHNDEHVVVVDEYHNPGTLHEQGDINVNSVYKFLLWLGGFIVIGYVVVFIIMKFNDHRADQMDAEISHAAKVVADRLPAEPRLQLLPGHTIHPLEEGLHYRDSMTQMMHSYAYINKAAGTVRLSIDRAKELLLQQGLPVRANPVQSADIDLTPEFTNGGRTYIQRDSRIPEDTETTNAIGAQ